MDLSAVTSKQTTEEEEASDNRKKSGGVHQDWLPPGLRNPSCPTGMAFTRGAACCTVLQHTSNTVNFTRRAKQEQTAI